MCSLWIVKETMSVHLYLAVIRSLWTVKKTMSVKNCLNLCSRFGQHIL